MTMSEYVVRQFHKLKIVSDIWIIRVDSVKVELYTYHRALKINNFFKLNCNFLAFLVYNHKYLDPKRDYLKADSISKHENRDKIHVINHFVWNGWSKIMTFVFCSYEWILHGRAI